LIERVSPRDGPSEVSQEIYLLSIASPHNVKVRNEQLDVKLLEASAADGLELWMPVFKHVFPVARRELSAVWGAWALCPAQVGRPSYTLAQFLEEVVAREPAIHAVYVTKSRIRFEVLGCQAEHARILVGETRWDTLALEHEDPRLIERAKAALGSDLPPGTNYPAMLKRAVGISVTPTLSLGASI
jgi:hypothetical protein